MSQALDDEDRGVRQAAVEALRQIGTEPALALLGQQSSASSLAPRDDEAFDPIPLERMLEFL